VPKPRVVTKSAPIKLPATALHRLIYVTGCRVTGGYTLLLHGFDGMADMPFNNHSVARRVCQTMREIAATRPDWFPPSSVAKAKTGPMYSA
jgi:hypothetical protein